MSGVRVVTCSVPVGHTASLWLEMGVLGSTGVALVAFMVSVQCPGQPTLVPGVAIAVSAFHSQGVLRHHVGSRIDGVPSNGGASLRR